MKCLFLAYPEFGNTMQVCNLQNFSHGVNFDLVQKRLDGLLLQLVQLILVRGRQQFAGKLVQLVGGAGIDVSEHLLEHVVRDVYQTKCMIQMF